MSWLPSLAGWQWAALAAVPIGIVLLYFLKLRRPVVRVPSTFLWSKTIEDLHVNSLLQRLRRNLLLFLQLLAVGLAALALLRPGYRDQASLSGRKVFLLDTSASMAATDVSPDANRFEQARRLIGEAIDGMRDGEAAMLITFSDRADVLQAFTSDRRRLREALSRAELTNRPTDIVEALRAAEGLANPNRSGQTSEESEADIAAALPADLLIHSDGNFASARDFDLGNLNPQYVRIGSDQVANVAVLAFSVDRSPEQPELLQAFATIANLGTESTSTTVTLTLDGAFVDAERLDLAAGEESAVSFLVQVGESADLELTLDADDALAVDNVAFAGIAPPRLVNVLLVTPGNPPLDLALSTGPAAELGRVETVPPSALSQDTYRQRAEAGEFDLILYDRCAPETPPRANAFFIGSLPPEGWDWGERSNRVLLVDIDRAHPLMRYLELYSLLIAEGRPLVPPPGAQVLLTGESGPLLAIAPRDGFQDLVLGFEILSQSNPDQTTDSETTLPLDADAVTFNSDWHVQRSWPVFVLNLLRHLGGAADGMATASYKPGEVVTLRGARPGQELTVQLPDGSRRNVTAGRGGTANFTNTNQIGRYFVTDAADNPLDRFHVNLFDRRESELAAVPLVSLGYESVEATVTMAPTRREYWRLLLLCVLGVMTLEWWLYAKRLG